MAAAKRARVSNDADVLLISIQAYPAALVKHWRLREHCDVALLDSSCSEHPAHRIVLASECGYMRGLFESDMSDCASPTIKINFPKDCVRAALDWIYCGRVTVPAGQAMLDLLEAATFLQITALQIAVAKAVATCLTPETCITAINLAESMTPEVPDLAVSASLYALHHFHELMEPAMHLQLQPAQLRALLIKSRLCADEEVVFNALVTWHAALPATPLPDMTRDFFGLARYPLLRRSFIRDCVWGEAVMQSAYMQQLVTESFMALHHGESWPPMATLAASMEELGPLLHGCAAVVPHFPANWQGIKKASADRWSLPCFDISRGTERFPLTLNCVLPARHSQVSGSVDRLYGQLPHGLEDSVDAASRFVYDAGPEPAIVKLQVFRRGRFSALGYGLRVLQDVQEGSMLLIYWGQYRTCTIQQWWRFDDILGGDCPPSDPDVMEAVERYWLSYSDEEGNFSIDPFNAGNAARWINHSVEDANLEMRSLAKTTTVPLMNMEAGVDTFEEREVPLLGLFATRDLRYGEELLWDYSGVKSARKSAPATGGVQNLYCDPIVHKSAPATGGVKHMPGSDVLGNQCELLRSVSNGKPHAGMWVIEQGSTRLPRRSLQMPVRATCKEVLVLQGESFPNLTSDNEDEDDQSEPDFELPDPNQHPLPTTLKPWSMQNDIDFDLIADLISTRQIPENYPWWTQLLPYWRAYPVHP